MNIMKRAFAALGLTDGKERRYLKYTWIYQVLSVPSFDLRSDQPTTYENQLLRRNCRYRICTNNQVELMEING